MRAFLAGLALVTACASRGTVAQDAGRTAARAADSLPTSEALVTGVESVGLTVSDMDRSMAFYSEVLDFEKESDVEVAGDAFEHLEGVFGARARVVRMRLGDEHLELTEYLASRGRSAPLDARSNDRWFQHVAIIVRDMDAAYARLRARDVVHASSAPQRLPDWNPNAGGIEAFYFKDPDGHPLEILAFPEGKGSAKWHRKVDRLFLGIDHTAIVVGNTEQSLRFYRDVLGFQVAGRSENFGTEQEHLNDVFGARLRITSLRAAEGPAIEFLEYLSPSDGRPYPLDAKASDLVHWQTRLTTRETGAAERKLLDADAAFVSPGAVRIAESKLGFSSGMLLRDPDGHALQLVH